MSRNLMLSFFCAALALVAGADGTLSFAHHPRLAGKASLTSPGFEVTRSLGEVAFAPELRVPVELVYNSSRESSGAFGFGWRSPQLESSVRWDKDGLLWTTPWGEQVKFFQKKAKTPKDAVKLAPIEAARKGRGLFAPYSDWEADANVTDYAKAREFKLSGKNGLKGWQSLSMRTVGFAASRRPTAGSPNSNTAGPANWLPPRRRERASSNWPTAKTASSCRSS